MSTPSLPDQAARDAIAADLASTLFVEAGAGSGKTRSLVGRILALVADGVPVDAVAAITFTEKAAGELRHRLRAELVEAHRRAGDAATADRYAAALAGLDGAAICTLHAFAQRLLTEHPIEAALPPGVEVMDELSSQLDLTERWRRFLGELLERPDLARVLLLANAVGIDHQRHLSQVARQLEDNWDLLDHPFWSDAADPVIDLAGLLDHYRTLAAARHAATGEDALTARLDLLDAHVADLESCLGELERCVDADERIDREIDVINALGAGPSLATQQGTPYVSLGSKKNWDVALKAELLADMGVAAERRAEIERTVVDACVRRLAVEVAAFVRQGVAERRRAGRLRFHDLLVLARQLLRDPGHGPAVRAAARRRYQRLLLDEFQDTDPIQVELAVVLATPETDIADRHWSELPIEPGRLFFVGDPKQSIYRFRRADIATYLSVRDALGGDRTLQLQCNFRSSPDICTWVNGVFERLIVAEPDAQPAYVPLLAVRPSPPSGPGVAVVGADEHPKGTSAADLRAAEAASVAGAVARAIAESWAVADEAADGGWRPCRLGDICILLPARTSLGALEQALEDAGIPARAETTSLVYATPEVRELLLVARAVDDPTDELTVVAALRSSAFGCGDDDLVRWRQRGGGFDHQRLGPAAADEVDDPVADGLRWLARAHQDRWWHTPGELLERIIRDRRLLELAVVEGRHRDVWRRLRFVVDQARAWTDITGGTVRAFLDWARLQGVESARVAETVVPETDHDAVRIMTIHAAKGLQFPITIVSGCTTDLASPERGVRVSFQRDGTPAIRLSASATTTDFDEHRALDEQLDRHERLRLLYVACTRAQDHLVVSCHRPAGSTKVTFARLLRESMDDAGLSVHHLGPSGPVHALPVAPSIGLPALADRPSWQAERTAALDAASRPSTVAATTLARELAPAADPGLDKDPRNLELPPWLKGRYGTAVGRAVHGALQVVDLATGAGLADVVAAQAAAEGVLGQEALIEDLCRSALQSEVVRQATRSPHWRELFVAAPVGGRLLEGYVDLCYRGPEGLVIVDYKTDAPDTDAELMYKVQRYGIQLAAYAEAVALASGEAVERAVLVFCRRGPALCHDLADLDQLRSSVRASLPAVVGGGEAVVE
ncbi:MAG: UvrD-helicase domain-containing protein [Acidimicrobiales bacterium]|nr:UvrD-helicase domain-containing protein [Acidimicrobiales bacterium]